MSDNATASDDRLRLLIERIERLEEENSSLRAITAWQGFPGETLATTSSGLAMSSVMMNLCDTSKRESRARMNSMNEISPPNITSLPRRGIR
jgi:hypothetical protein